MADVHQVNVEPKHEDGSSDIAALESKSESEHNPSTSVAESAPMQKQIADAASIKDQTPTVATENESHSSSLWIIGNVVMVSESKPIAMEQASKMRSHSSAEGSSAQKKTKGTISIHHGELANHVQLQQRSMKELPESRRTNSDSSSRIETLIEQTSSGLSLTLFADDIKETDLENATIESPTDDELVVNLPKQRIVYHIPADWLKQQRTLQR